MTVDGSSFDAATNLHTQTVTITNDQAVPFPAVGLALHDLGDGFQFYNASILLPGGVPALVLDEPLAPGASKTVVVQILAQAGAAPPPAHFAVVPLEVRGWKGRPFTVEEVSATSDGIELHIATEPGQSYQIESSGDLKTWTQVGPPIESSGDRLRWRGGDAGSEGRWWRARRLE